MWLLLADAWMEEPLCSLDLVTDPSTAVVPNHALDQSSTAVVHHHVDANAGVDPGTVVVTSHFLPTAAYRYATVDTRKQLTHQQHAGFTVLEFHLM